MLSKISKYLIKIRIKYSKEIKIIIGAGNTKYKGWISTDINELDITKHKDFDFLFKNKKIDNILMEHVVEHLEYEAFISFLYTVKKYLKKGGVIRIAVPDSNHPSLYVKKLTVINGIEPGANDHKYFYSIKDFEDIAEKTGFTLKKLEYFDFNGFFHISQYDFKNGYISRCSKNYKGRFTDDKDEYQKMIETVPNELKKQFFEKGISYTSLLVDFIYD